MSNYVVLSGSVVKCWALDHCSNPLAAISELGQCYLPRRCLSSLSCINKYLAIESGGYKSMNSHHVVVVVWP